MKIDMTCPAELRQSSVPTSENPCFTFDMLNICGKTIVSVQFTLSCYNASDELLFRQTERIQGIRASQGEEFSFPLSPAQSCENINSLDFTVEKVWFSDSTVWRRGNLPFTYYESNALPNGRALDELRFVAGEDAVGYPEYQKDLWLCVCGRPNPIHSETCCRCDRMRDSVFASFSEENVRRLSDSHEERLKRATKKANEANSVLQEQQEKQLNAQKRLRRAKIRKVVTAVTLLIAAVCFLLFGVPAIRYRNAQGLLSQERYDEAQGVFSALSGYRDSAELALECDYRKASSLLTDDSEASLSEAEMLFLSLEDYKDSPEQAKESAYRLGCFYLDVGSFDEAAFLFTELDGYSDSAAQLTETTYRKARAAADDGAFEEARALFFSLEAYADSAEQATECGYQIARSALEAKEFQTAKDEFTELGSYKDSALLLQQTYYEWGLKELNEARYGEAGQLFLQAGSYKDAPELGTDCTYRQAAAEMENRCYGEARSLLETIPDYKDSNRLMQDCLYQEGLQLKENGDPEGVVALLEAAVCNSQMDDLLKSCLYELGLNALETQDYAYAESCFARCSGYADSKKQLRSVRYGLAQEDMERGNYASAAERFEALGNYKDSLKNTRRCKYALASAAEEAKDYETAAELYKTLGSYKDSRTRERAMRVLQARTLWESGELLSAKGILESTAGQEAKALYQDIVMEEAAGLAENGQYEQASVLYESLSGNETAAEKAKACRYSIAGNLREQGDLIEAGKAFAVLGKYRDASTQSLACYEAYFGTAAEEARKALKEKDYLTVIVLLSGYELSDLSKPYDDLDDIYHEACFQYAEALYDQHKPYEAIPFYQKAGTYRDANVKLTHRAYLILGRWTSLSGFTAEFRPDGTCTIMGEELFFRVSNYSLYTGTDPESMTITHKLSTLKENTLKLRDIRNGEDHVFTFGRDGKFVLPEMELPEEVQARIAEKPVVPMPASEETDKTDVLSEDSDTAGTEESYVQE